MRRHRCKSHVSLVQWLWYAPDSSALSYRNIQENQLALHRLGSAAERHCEGCWGMGRGWTLNRSIAQVEIQSLFVLTASIA